MNGSDRYFLKWLSKASYTMTKWWSLRQPLTKWLSLRSEMFCKEKIILKSDPRWFSFIFDLNPQGNPFLNFHHVKICETRKYGRRKLNPNNSHHLEILFWGIVPSNSHIRKVVNAWRVCSTVLTGYNIFHGSVCQNFGQLCLNFENSHWSSFLCYRSLL